MRLDDYENRRSSLERFVKDLAECIGADAPGFSSGRKPTAGSGMSVPTAAVVLKKYSQNSTLKNNPHWFVETIPSAMRGRTLLVVRKRPINRAGENPPFKWSIQLDRLMAMNRVGSAAMHDLRLKFKLTRAYGVPDREFLEDTHGIFKDAYAG